MECWNVGILEGCAKLGSLYIILVVVVVSCYKGWRGIPG